MQTSDAYSALVKELETLGQRPARELAALAGWSFGQLAQWIVEDAGCSR